MPWIQTYTPLAGSLGMSALLAAVPLRVRRIVVRLANAAVVFHSANQRVRSASCARDDLLAYVVFGERVCGTVNGLAVRPGLMLAVEPETQARFVTEPGWQSVAVMLSARQLQEHWLARQQRIPRFAPCQRP